MDNHVIAFCSVTLISVLLFQDAISKLKVCLLGTMQAALECLRLLVLPGIGEFTIVSDECVQPADIQHGFLLEPSFFFQKPKCQVRQFRR